MSDNFKSNFGTVLQIGSGSGTPYTYTDVKGVYLVPPIESEQEKIEVIPTLVIYSNGQALASIVAPESKAVIENFLRENLGL